MGGNTFYGVEADFDILPYREYSGGKCNGESLWLQLRYT